MSWEMGIWGLVSKAFLMGVAIRSRDKGSQAAAVELVPADEPEPPPPPPMQGLQLIATDPPRPALPPPRLKAAHLAQVAALRFHAYMLEVAEEDPALKGPLRSPTVYGLYVEWSTEDEGREALSENVFLDALKIVPGVEKRQTSYPLKGRERRSFRWWFEAKPTAAARRERAEAVMHTAKPKRKRAKKRRRK